MSGLHDVRTEKSSPHPGCGHAQSRRGQFFPMRLFFWVRLLVGIIFIAASVDKILYPAAFAQTIYNYQTLPDTFINVTAIFLPWMELVVGGMLVLGLWLPGAVVVANLLFLAFFGSLLFNLARGLNIHCGCFSSNADGGDPTNTWYVVRDGVFLLLSGYLFYQVFLKPARPPEGQQLPQ